MAYAIGAGPATESYLRMDARIDVAKKAKVDAIHPGYGFLSENAAFVDAVEEAGLTFIGPPAQAMRRMGVKTQARELMRKAGVPTVPGSDGPVASEAEARKAAEKLGYPVFIKAAAGGGGKGMRIVGSGKDLAGAYRAACSEAQNAFGDATVYLEKALINPRHVELQIFGGPDGKSIWLGERECSMQRRHQKIIEETPCVALDDSLRAKMGEVACRAADAVDYVGAGTIEFLLGEDHNFYFLEMNTRLQVEHPVTELVCGIDLVEGQILVAQGDPLPWRQESIVRKGHAMEARVYAEDPGRNFMPCPGHVVDLVLPHGPGVRVDCGVAGGFEVPRYYDPMIAKVAVWAEDREHARRRLNRALTETAVKGITTNSAFLRQLLDLPAFAKGDYHTGSVEAALAMPKEPLAQDVRDVAIAAAVLNAYRRDSRTSRQARGESGHSGHWRPWRWRAAGGG